MENQLLNDAVNNVTEQPETTQEAAPVAARQYLNINEVHEVESYPYGRLRTKAYFSIEFHPNKGFRTVFQTLNPKTLTPKLNAPKKSTYMDLAYNYIEPETGHIKNAGIGKIWDLKNVLACANAINSKIDAICFTPAMIQYVAKAMLQNICISLAYSKNKEAYKEYFKPYTEALAKMINTGENLMSELLTIDIEKANSIADANE